jgi:hypothetical protein
MFFLWLPIYWAYRSEFECLGDLGVRSFFILPEVVGEFLVYLGIG